MANTIKDKIRNEIAESIKTKIADKMLVQLMEKFDNEIVSYEDREDPMRPSICKDEFDQSLRESIENSLVVTENNIKFGVGDENHLGFGRSLDDNTTDCMKIVGTILQGIVGEYVLITSQLAREMFPGDRNTRDLGRTGKAYLMGRKSYDAGILKYGWPRRPSWGFSNFKGVPDFFDDIDIGLGEAIESVIKLMKS